MIFSSQDFRRAIRGEMPMISSCLSIREENIQPASLDCLLGDCVYAMKSAGFPRPTETVEDYIKRYCSGAYTMKDGREILLRRENCYLVPLCEGLSLEDSFFAKFSPKSSIGRGDVFVRTVVDKYARYDRTPKGYHGPLYLEVSPLSFHSSLYHALSLVQMRIQESDDVLFIEELSGLHERYGIVHDIDGKIISDPATRGNGFLFHIDLSREIVGFEALDVCVQDLSLGAVDAYEMRDFWRPIPRPRDGTLVLTNGRFYLLATKERVKIPPECCAEIVPYDVTTGEFRTHYAGFFDNGFGGEYGTTPVLEVRASAPDFRFFDGQPICSMDFQRTLDVPDKLYGDGINSHYTGSGPSLPKQFKDREKVWR